jgi:hypothetical protein
VLKDEQDSAGQIDNDEHKREEQDCEQNVGRAAVRKGHAFTGGGALRFSSALCQTPRATVLNHEQGKKPSYLRG